MRYQFPTVIVFISDCTEAKFIREDVKAKEPTAFYQFTKSITNLDKVFPMSKNTIDKLVENKLAKCT